MSGTVGRAKEHAPEEWERIKRPFCDLYHKQKKTLAEVRQTLEREENFNATERQYKRKIKLWNLRKNANVGDYSHIDQLMQSRSKVPLSDVFMSRGIPITDDKIRRYVRHNGKKVPAIPEKQVSSPPDSTRNPSSPDKLLGDDETAGPWSPSAADETTPELDIGELKSNYMQLLEKYRQMQDLVVQLDLKNQTYSEMLRFIASEAARYRDSLARATRTSPQRTTQQQLGAQPYYHELTSQKKKESKSPGLVPPQPDTKDAPAPAPEILAVREANAKKSWRTVTINGADCLGDLQQPYDREARPFEKAFKAAVQPDRATAHLSIDDIFGLSPYRDMAPPAVPADIKAMRKVLLARQFRALYPEVKSYAVAATTASKPDDPRRGLWQFPPSILKPGAADNMWSAILD